MAVGGGAAGAARAAPLFVPSISTPYKYARSCVRTIGMLTACKPAGTDSASSSSIGMSASHSPTIGDKPIELLTIAERCDFGRGLIIFGHGLKICARA